MIYHMHLVLRAKIQNPPKPEHNLKTELWVKQFVKDNKMEIQEKPKASYVRDKGNRGMTCCCLIKTSHIAFHVWDELKPALLQFDFYTCGRLEAYRVLKSLDKYFSFISYEYMILDRKNTIEVHNLSMSLDNE